VGLLFEISSFVRLRVVAGYLIIGLIMNFDEYRIVPRKRSYVDSRKNVSTAVHYKRLSLDVPVICPAMHSLVSSKLVENVESAGSAVVQPRGLLFPTSDKPIYNVSLDKAYGMTEKFGDYAIIAIELNNGYLDKLHREIYRIKDSFPNSVIWAGAVCSIEGCKLLADAGADAVIVGNGVGSVCETTLRTSVGLPPLDTLVDCQNSPIPVILAGGIRKIGDIALALAFGADLVMIGSLLASCNDTSGNGRYWGEASATQKQNNEYIEGREIILPVSNKSSYDVIQEIKQGLQSACSFVDATTILQFKENAQVVKI
jgi:GMP reductase